MIFPRDTIVVGNCIAVVRAHSNKTGEKGDPYLRDKYPLIVYDGIKWRGNRLSYHLNVEPLERAQRFGIKDGMIMHTCDNKWCVNPDHLYKGSSRDNAIDRMNRNPNSVKALAKGRSNIKSENQSNGQKRRWANTPLEERMEQHRKMVRNDSQTNDHSRS